MTKTILGLDLGTNSIGWALIKQDFEERRSQKSFNEFKFQNDQRFLIIQR